MHSSTTDWMIGLQTSDLLVEAVNFLTTVGPSKVPSAEIIPACLRAHFVKQHHIADLLSDFGHSVLHVSSKELFIIILPHGFEGQQELPLTPFGYVLMLHPGKLSPN